MANENVMWSIIWFCFFNDISLIRPISLIGHISLISPISYKRTIPLQIIGTGLFIIQCGLLNR